MDLSIICSVLVIFHENIHLIESGVMHEAVFVYTILST